MTAQVASPARMEALDKLQGTRRSILANMSSPPGSPSKAEEAPSQSPSAQVQSDGPRTSNNNDASVAAEAEDPELNILLGKTDSILRSRGNGANRFSSLRRSSVQPEKSPSPPAQSLPLTNGGYNGSFVANSSPRRSSMAAQDSQTVFGGAQNSNSSSAGSMQKLRRRLSNLSQTSKKDKDDDDRASISSGLSSHRDAISSFIRRSRSRSGSQEPEAAAQNGSTENGTLGRRRTLSASSRRLSLKLPGKLSRKRSSSAVPDDDVPPVPSLPDGSQNRTPSTTSAGADSASRTSSNGRAAPEGYPAGVAAPATDTPRKTSVRTGSKKSSQESSHDVSASAASPRKANGRSSTNNGPSSTTENKPDERSYLGAATAAVATAGAAVGGTAAALASRVTGKGADDGYNSESDDDDDVFHDAELADIEEGEEDDVSSSSHKVASPSKQSSQTRTGRHRGLSEASGTQIATHRTNSPTNVDGDQSTGDAGIAAVGAASSPGPSKLKGTSGAKRRAGSTPIPASSSASIAEDSNATPQDAKAKKDVPAEVREKAARVAKLRFDDVTQSTDEMYEDIKVARGALHLFLNSRMIEAEEIIKEHADKRMYYALGYGLIATMKGFMTFEPEDLAVAISYCKDSMHIAHLLRKQSNAVANLGRFVRGTGHGPSAMANMTLVERHAELVYAESLLLKAVLGIVYSGDFFGFVAEALNMRNAYGIYRSLGKYVETADSKASSNFDKSIDQDFRSGVFLGNGLISLILGLLPGKILKVMDVFGYSGDTKAGLETLMKAGGWSQNSSRKEPKMSMEREGIRRPVCDMGVLLFHLVISVFIPVTGVDIQFADKVLHYHLERYPQGVFFLYFSGRLYSTQALCERAVKQYAAARDAQQEYVQLQHISWWDASLCHMSLAQWSKARECFEVLLKESNWSKAVYSYGVAANILQDDPDNKEAAALLNKVPGLMQRIAGKSIPMEKFVARKAHKFNTQGRLLLPAIEFSYIYHCLSNAPRYALTDEQLVTISNVLSELTEVEDPAQYYSGADEYWDDFCLAHFLRGVTLKYIAHPEPHAKLDPPESDIPVDEAEEQAMLSFKTVLDHGHKIANDFWYIYFSHYELGRLHGNMGNEAEARKELDLVLSGKMLEDKGNRSGKHKYSMQNMALLRSNGALNAMDKK